MTLRIFAPSYSLLAHEATAYARLRHLPYKLYCSDFCSSLLAGFYHRAQLPVRCVVTADGRSHLQIWQLARAQREAETAAFARASAEASCEAVTRTAVVAARAASYTMLLGRRDHSCLHLVNWTTVVFVSWWLYKVGLMYRYCRGNKVDMAKKMIQYIVPLPFVGVPGLLTSKFRSHRQAELANLGIAGASMDFLDEHFRRTCVALEAHLAQQQPSSLFLLGTRHPTLADVTLGAAFSTFFLQDDPPASFLTEHCPHLLAYVERVVTPREGVAEAEAPMPDAVPATLGGFLALQLEVMPFLVAQCAAFTAFMLSDAVRTMRREALGPPWQGCHGYLLPELSEVRALMIVDDTINIIRAQSRDLEIALLAASEVIEGEGAAEASTAWRGAQLSATQGPFAAATDSGAGAAGGGDDGSLTTARQAPSLPTSQTRDNRVAVPQVFDFCSSFVEMSAEEADFYRVFSNKGRRAQSLTPQSAHVVPGASTLTPASEVLARQPIAEQLRYLRHMMRQMHNPQYTLATVAIGLRMYVAAIPEFEVARLRPARPAV